MEWWYKCEDYGVTASNSRLLIDALMNTLVQKNVMRIANLYDDDEHYYIRTTNNIALHTFLFKYGFEEVYDDDDIDEDDLSLLFGHE